MKRADEEFCKVQFDAFINQFFIPSQVTWKDVTPQNEPPDYYLLLNNTKFAVEVTTLIELVSVGSSSLPHSVIRRFFEQFVDKIESNARSEGYLQGDYLVSFPTPIDDFASVRDEIQAKLLEYIHSTKALEKASLEMVFEKVISQQRPQQCGIQKVGSHLDRVVAGGPVWFKWEGDAARDICDLLIESLLTKVNKLRNINEPKILLLLDEYSFADRYMYENCLSHLSSLVDFHTIFVVYSSKGGFTLHSENRNWLN